MATLDNVSPSDQNPESQEEEGRRVNKVIYCVLAFFLGGFGVHKFYAGKIGMGIIYLLLSWTCIPGFIAFIEFILALFKPSDSQGDFVP